jgi:glycosyltransferase involved in cell wall biosynthesis
MTKTMTTAMMTPTATTMPSTAVPRSEEKRPDVSVLVPVLNEEQSIVELVERVTAVLEEAKRSFEIVFIDDGSSDGTAERIRELNGQDLRVKMVRFRRNFGKAAALSAGVELSRGEILVTIDGDLQDVPEEIPRLLEKLETENLDLVSGWKRDRQDPISKRYPSKLFNWATRKLAGIDLHDFNCGFKAYRREVLEQVPIYGELHRYIPVLAGRRGFRVGELQVAHERRRFGVSKYGWDRLYKGLLDLITVLFITTYMRRPLHLFGLLGLGTMFFGLTINLYLGVSWLFFGTTLSFRPLLQLGILLTLLGVQFLTTGLLGEMLTFKNFNRGESYSIREKLE